MSHTRRTAYLLVGFLGLATAAAGYSSGGAGGATSGAVLTGGTDKFCLFDDNHTIGEDSGCQYAKATKTLTVGTAVGNNPGLIIAADGAPGVGNAVSFLNGYGIAISENFLFHGPHDGNGEAMFYLMGDPTDSGSTLESPGDVNVVSLAVADGTSTDGLCESPTNFLCNPGGATLGMWGADNSTLRLINRSGGTAKIEFFLGTSNDAANRRGYIDTSGYHGDILGGNVAYSGTLKITDIATVTNNDATISHRYTAFSTGNTGRTATLPASSGGGAFYEICKTDAGTGTVTVTRAGADTIVNKANGSSTSLVLTGQGACETVYDQASAVWLGRGDGA